MAILAFTEASKSRAFACAIDWPGWCRSGKTAELAAEALEGHRARYAAVVARAGYPLPDQPVEVVERLPGSSGTEFGVPASRLASDDAAVSEAEARRFAAILWSAWEVFDEIAANAPAALRKGPRGGGRDTAKVVAHLADGDRAYVRHLGLKFSSSTPIDVVRAAMLRRAGAAVGWLAIQREGVEAEVRGALHHLARAGSRMGDRGPEREP